MRCLTCLTLFSLLAFPPGHWEKNEPNDRPNSAETGTSIPDSSVPYALRDFWLRFHELGLCQKMHTTFAFHGDQMEIWCRVENEKAFRRFIEMLDPLRISNSIELHVAEGPRSSGGLDENDPPPSLWNNAELRYYFQGGPQIASASAITGNFGEPEPGIILKQRLIMYAEQTLNWSREMRRYGEHLPDLVGAAFDPTAAPNTKSRAAAVCLQHVEALDKLAERLNQNLVIALPRASGKSTIPPASETSENERSFLKKRAVAISNTSQAIAQRIYLFIYPQDFGVNLSDLKDPDLLESLKNLRSMLATFGQELRHQQLSEP